MKLNALFCVIFFVFCVKTNAFTQKKIETSYFNADGDLVRTKAKASYYRVVQTNGKRRITVEYDSTDMKLGETSYRKDRPQIGVGDSVWWKYGSFREWYASGQLKAEGSYILDRLHDNLKTYYPNGALRRNDVYYIDTLKQAHYYAEDSTELPHVPYREQAEFKGGQAEMFRYLGENIVYPLESRREGIEGTVYVGFTISRTGAVENVKIKVSVDENLDEEALRVVKSMPTWKPAKQEGALVRIAFTLPVRFKLS
jgi:TonB family protein